MFLFFGAKIRCFLLPRSISPKGMGENPYFFILCLRSSIYDYDKV